MMTQETNNNDQIKKEEPIMENVKEENTQVFTDSVITNDAELQDLKPLTIGELIKQKRLEKDLSLKVISQQTRISLSLLENLENNRIDNLPSQAYVRGFVRSTAKILNIDMDEALEALEYTYSPTGVKTKKVVKKSQVKDSPENLKGRESIILAQNFIGNHIGLFAKVITGIAIVGSIGYFVSDYIAQLPKPEVIETTAVSNEIETTNLQTPEQNQSSSFNQDLKPVTEAVKETTTPTLPVSAATIPVIAEKENPTSTITTPVVDSTNKLEVKVEPKEVVKPKKEVKLTSIDSSKALFQETDMTTEEYNELLPSRFRVATSGTQQAIFLNALDGDSWLTYKTDNNEIKKFVLRQGRTLLMRGETIRLFLGNPANLRIFYNNVPVKINGNVRNIVVPEAKRSEFKQPLFIYQDDGSVLTSDQYETMRSSEDA